MTTNTITYRVIKLFVLISTFLLILSSCDIIDEIMGSNEDTPNIDLQVQEINTVFDVQSNTVFIMENLFSTMVDTLAVLDSMTAILKSDPAVNDAWNYEEGISIEYTSGILGGIYLEQDYSNAKLHQSNTNPNKITSIKKTQHLNLKKETIFIDNHFRSDSPWRIEQDTTIIYGTRQNFRWIGLDPFEYQVFTGEWITIDLMRNLDKYGIIHLAGHGSRHGSDGKKIHYRTWEKFKRGDVTYYQELKNKELSIIGGSLGVYYAITPQFINNNNNFNTDGNSTLFFAYFKNSFTNEWKKELVDNAGVDVYIGLSHILIPRDQTRWSKDFYNEMSYPARTEPLKIDDWHNNLVISGDDCVDYYKDGTIYRSVCIDYYGDPDFTFWRNSGFKELVDACAYWAIKGDITYIADIKFYESRSEGQTSPEGYSLYNAPPCFSQDKYPLWQEGDDYPACYDTSSNNVEIRQDNYTDYYYYEIIDGDHGFYHTNNGNSATSYWEERISYEGESYTSNLKTKIDITFNDSREYLNHLEYSTEFKNVNNSCIETGVKLTVNTGVQVNTTNLWDIKFHQGDWNHWIWYEMNNKNLLSAFRHTDSDCNLFDLSKVIDMRLKLLLYIPNSDLFPPGG